MIIVLSQYQIQNAKVWFSLNIVKSFWKCHVKPGRCWSKWGGGDKKCRIFKIWGAGHNSAKIWGGDDKKCMIPRFNILHTNQRKLAKYSPLAFLAKTMFMFTLFLAFDPTIFIFHRSKHYIRHQKFVILTRITGIPLLLIKAVVLAGLKDKIHVPGPALFNSKSHRQIGGVCIVVESSIANSN